MDKYRKKNDFVLAFQLDETFLNEFDNGRIKLPERMCVEDFTHKFFVDTDYGFKIVEIDDWILEDQNGVYSVVKPDIFELTYEKIDD